MPSKNKVSVTARISEDEMKRLEMVANIAGISISALMKLLVNAVINNDIEVEKGELKLGVEPIGYAVSQVSEEEFQENLRYKELKLDRLVSAFERKKYPDQAIRQCVEQIVGQVLDGGNFNPRRSYDSDCGC